MHALCSAVMMQARMQSSIQDRLRHKAGCLAGAPVRALRGRARGKQGRGASAHVSTKPQGSTGTHGVVSAAQGGVHMASKGSAACLTGQLISKQQVGQPVDAAHRRKARQVLRCLLPRRGKMTAGGAPHVVHLWQKEGHRQCVWQKLKGYEFPQQAGFWGRAGSLWSRAPAPARACCCC